MRGRRGLTFQLSPAHSESCICATRVIFRLALVSDVKLYIRRRTRSHVISALSHHSNCVRIRTLLRFDVFQIYQQSRWVCYVFVYLPFVRESEWVRAFVYNYTCSASKCALILCRGVSAYLSIFGSHLLVKVGVRILNTNHETKYFTARSLKISYIPVGALIGASTGLQIVSVKGASMKT